MSTSAITLVVLLMGKTPATIGLLMCGQPFERGSDGIFGERSSRGLKYQPAMWSASMLQVASVQWHIRLRRRTTASTDWHFNLGRDFKRHFQRRRGGLCRQEIRSGEKLVQFRVDICLPLRISFNNLQPALRFPLKTRHLRNFDGRFRLPQRSG